MLLTEIFDAILGDRIRKMGNAAWPIAHGAVERYIVERIADNALTCTICCDYRVDDRLYTANIKKTVPTEREAVYLFSIYHVGLDLAVRYKPGQPNINVVRDADNLEVSQRYV